MVNSPNTSALSPADAVFRIAGGMSASAIVLAAARLRIADAVGDEPAAVRAIAKRIDAAPDGVSRLLRALSVFGIFEQVDPEHYRHTAMSRAMRSGQPEKLLESLLTGGAWGWMLWEKLADAVRSGKCVFPEQHGTDFFSYMDENPNDHSLLDHGINAWSDPLNPSVVDALDFTGVRTFSEMGGGRGGLLRLVLERHPGTRGVLFDSESGLRVVQEALRTGELSDRCELVAGDFFQKVTHAADLYLFKLTLHMYEDEPVIQALRNCAEAAPPGARVVIADPLLVDPPSDRFAPVMDLHMLCVMGGRERTERAFKSLFERAGLRFRGVTPTSSVLWLAEGEVPA